MVVDSKPGPAADQPIRPETLPRTAASRRVQLRAGAVLDASADPRFNPIAALAAGILRVPIAVVSLIDQDGAWHKSGFGLVACGAAVRRDVGFCACAVARPDAMLVVPDAAADARFAGSPAVAGAPHVRFYAGVALRSADGRAVGVFCVLDTVPRQFSDAERVILTDLAQCALALVELHRGLAELQECEAHHRQAMGSRPHLPWVADAAGRLLEINPRIAALYGEVPGWLVGLPWTAFAHPEDRERTEALWSGCVVTGRTLDTELRMQGGDGDYHWFRCHAAPRRTAEGVILRWYGTIEDITRRRDEAALAAHLATHDPLTGLMNRPSIAALLDQQVASGAGPFALFSLDLDNLKGVNNTRGSAAGDAVLCEAANRLRACLGAGDLLARSGGDEFLLIRLGIERCEQAGELARQILAAFEAPLLTDAQPLALGVSIGIALWPRDALAAADLLSNAALSLSRAKAAGRATFRFFSAAADESLRTQQALQLDLNEALQRGEFALAFQPLIDLRSGQVDGFEALLRWRHPARGTVSPLDFIPMAESSGLIVPIGQWVLEQACHTASCWPGSVSVAVNLSPIQFGSPQDLLRTVQAALAASGLDPRRLELEITESLPLLDNEDNLAVLEQLRALGVRIALDDFGTGYSSLGYLQRFAFDKLKIDRSIIARVVDGDASRTILRAIVGMAHTLGIRVTAEGVEVAEQADCLRAEGCDQVQGFLFSRPVPANEVMGAIARQAA
jgi:diguanylate cyclase (GGDEF)-like protein/PAS domain S-box-containing protein